MLKINHLGTFLYFTLIFTSCEDQLKVDETCVNKFKTARELAYENSGRLSALDSAMTLANECMQCDSIRKAVVEFKINLLASRKMYAEGIVFVDSLNEKDFAFGYKQNFISKELQALEFKSKNNVIKENLIYREIVNDMEDYIISKINIGNKEFIEVYTDLFAAKEKCLDANQINKEVEALKIKHPDKKSFFDFFKH